ncbi:MAG: DUF1223 domain-containing protein [Hyphomicrobiaceae bacterium]
MRILKLFSAVASTAIVPLMGLFGGSQAYAQTPAAPDNQPKAVLELYTSQGCSSCPTADALLGTYARRGDIVGLTLPVDYWDYLGWKDTLADAKFTARQRAYAKSRGDGRIYTPQVVVNGLAHVNGAQAKDIDYAITKTAAKLSGIRIPVRVASQGDKIVIDIGAVAEGDRAEDGAVWLAFLRKEVQVPVRKGENQGQMLTYYNVVREWKQAGTWNGQPMTIQVDRQSVKSDVDSCAVLLQGGMTGPIVGAAYLGKL